MNDPNLNPESLMMSYGYNPEWSEMSVKPPIFQTSTFAFKTAEQGKAFFQMVLGNTAVADKHDVGLIYSRINNPNLEILEDRLCLWDKAEDCAVFESGMSAISTAILEFVKPGDVVLHSNPLYGGTNAFIHKILDRFKINAVSFEAGETFEAITEKVKSLGFEDKIAVVYIETPANPNNALFDLTLIKKLADFYSTNDKKVISMADNTYMGPLWSQPIKFGIDLVLYSATKYIAGHSDAIAGACLGKTEHIKRIKGLRTYLGGMAGPFTAWLLLRSLETLKIRMEQQAINAAIVAEYLKNHPKIEKVYYLGFIPEGTEEYRIYKNQYSSAGAMLSFDLKGGEKEAFIFLNNLKLAKLAVSLGSTESLASHPYTMTHAGTPEDEKQKSNVTEKLIRFSVGLENAEDLINDIKQALERI